MTPQLELRDVSVAFGAARAVDGVSLSLYRGEILGVVGESGSGKSQMLRAIMRQPPREARLGGAVLWQGQDLMALGERAMRGVRGREIALITQDASTALNRVLPIGTQIVESLAAHTTLDRAGRRARAIALLDLVGIANAADRLGDHPHLFSGGMLQRVMIAIALASEPGLLLADEPTTALDVTIQEEILRLLLSLRDRLGMSIVLVTHDLGVIARLCERVVVMYSGRIVESGTVATLFAGPRHPYTRGLLASVPGGGSPRAMLSAIEGTTPAIADRPAGCAFHPRCAAAQPPCTASVPRLQPARPNHEVACLRQAELVEA
ncbi:ABC transporter ATP-binding protein [Lichenicoccus sp.]|uniref:ABC transporter ATP-binding protein n=1 Tax=Lichenicoccus sp. TaxID=2781899 RepID=UPI003D0DE10A